MQQANQAEKRQDPALRNEVTMGCFGRETHPLECRALLKSLLSATVDSCWRRKGAIDKQAAC
ncbi:hypothetical protein brsh051_21200 [Brooklawnia propionicigenes]|uniref:Uncharacterized protein n=1 Tax=Brooklawnia propionicigenes TaxID=3041175 RepID=A0AAN0KES5_9ACTN|nr:hypothetical protein brsh051_21200 [Brooklawnia sp. SH051]